MKTRTNGGRLGSDPNGGVYGPGSLARPRFESRSESFEWLEATAGHAVDQGLRLTLLGPFALTKQGRPVRLPPGSQRLVALAAIAGEPMSRYAAASHLWPEADENKAAANLRSALWRLGQTGCKPLRSFDGVLLLDDAVKVDLREVRRLAQALLQGVEPPESIIAAISMLQGRVLPGWFDDWVIREGELLQQLQVYALECLAEKLLGRRAFATAYACAIAVTRMEPLRESGHRLVCQIHLAEGNLAQALRHYESTVALLQRELGIGPSDMMRRLMTTARRDV